MLGDSYFQDYQKKQRHSVQDTHGAPFTRPRHKWQGHSIRLHKLSEEKKIVNLEIRIKQDNTWVVDHFDWNLNHEHISIKEFVEQWVEQGGLEKDNVRLVYDQMMNQLLAHIDSQQNGFRGNQGRQVQRTLENIKQNTALFHQIKDISVQPVAPSEHPMRIRTDYIRNKQVQKLRSSKESSISYDKTECQVCQYKQSEPVSQCQKCLIPFSFLLLADLHMKSTRQALRFFGAACQIIYDSKTFPVQEMVNSICPEVDFISLKSILGKIQPFLKSSSRVQKAVLNKIQKSYDQYQDGHQDEDPFIADDSQYSKNSKFSQDQRIQALIRQKKRGRPISFKTIKKFISKNNKVLSH